MTKVIVDGVTYVPKRAEMERIVPPVFYGVDYAEVGDRICEWLLHDVPLEVYGQVRHRFMAAK